MRHRLLHRTALPLLAIALAAGLQAQQPQSWIHIHVTERGDDAKQVRVNLPLGLAEVALGMASNEMISNGRIKLSKHEVSVEDLRRMWNELKTSGDAEFLTVEEKDKKVKIVREGDQIRIHVDGRGEEQKRVRIEVPVSLDDALLAGDGQTLDLQGALAELKDERGDIVIVHDGEKSVRIWVDESKS